jgi:TRAP transporter TAXI family solute receptor
MGRDSRRFFLARALALGVAACGLRHAMGQSVRRITIGANPAGTNFNLVAGGFAKVLQEQLGIPSIVRPYSGSSVYIPLLQRGEIALGVNSSLDSYLAFRGLSPYPAAMRNLRALLAIYPLGYMYWVRASSGLRRIEDLKSKRVVVNYRGLVVLDQLNRAILASAGLSDTDIDPVTTAGLDDGARAVQEGRADAVAMGYRLPLVTQMHAAIPGGLRFLTMGANEARVSELMPGAWVDTLVPGPATVGIEQTIRIANYQTYLNTGTHLPAEVAHDIVAAIHAQWSSLQRDYAVLAPVPATQLAPANHPLPYHSGAARYFVSAGLWSEAHDAAQTRLLA